MSIGSPFFDRWTEPVDGGDTSGVLTRPTADLLNRRNDVNRSGSIDQQLRFAIANRFLIQLQYDESTRIVEPHDYGMQQNGPKLLVYQLRRVDDASGKRGTGWRLFDVDKVQQCVVLEETFPGSRAEGHQHRYRWSLVYARVP